ncbi:MAG: tripartite tricarboxylate transporter substrate binding protein [Burkholderiales bacterium]
MLDSILKLFVAVAASANLSAVAATTDVYPSKPVRIVVPYAPGGSNDVVSRAITPKLAEMWKQPAIIDNRAGAGSMIGTEIVVHAAPDGYTLLATSGALAINATLLRLPFNPLTDLAPIAFMAQLPYVLGVHPSVPAKSTQELISYARANPGKLSFGSAGTATATHLTGELFKSLAKVDLLHVPYKGGGPAINAIVGNEVQVIFNAVTGILPHVKSGRVRALAVSSIKRAEIAPELPTVAETGVPGFDVVSGYTLFAPARTPRAIVDRVNRDVNNVLQQPETRERFLALGVTPIVSTPETLAEYMKREIARWAKVIKAIGVKPE